MVGGKIQGGRRPGLQASEASGRLVSAHLWSGGTGGTLKLMSQEQVFRNLPVNSLEDMGSALGVSPSWPAGSDESSLAGITISLPMNVSVAAPFLHPCPDCCGLRQYPGSPPLLSPSWGPHPDTGLSAPYPLHYLGLIKPPADSGQALCLLQTPKPSYPWAPLVSPWTSGPLTCSLTTENGLSLLFFFQLWK